MKRFAIISFLCFNFIPQSQYDLLKLEEKPQEDITIEEVLESDNYQNVVISKDRNEFLDKYYSVIETYSGFIVYHQ